MGGAVVTPDQWAGLGHLAFLLAIGLTVFLIYRELFPARTDRDTDLDSKD